MKNLTQQFPILDENETCYHVVVNGESQDFNYIVVTANGASKDKILEKLALSNPHSSFIKKIFDKNKTEKLTCSDLLIKPFPNCVQVLERQLSN
jgi:acid stress-induced BolA-like protein IbaG/YrbA